MKGLRKVCRLCLNENGMLLDLFGNGKTSFAADIETCLSLEVKECDGFPQDICIKCVGQLEECTPFFNKVIKLHEEGLDKNLSESICYFCHSNKNHLFPIPHASLKLTEACFNFKVSRKSKICHHCQFYLDTLFELKQKALTSVTQLARDNTSSVQVEVPEEDTVANFVRKLESKFGSAMAPSPHKKRRREKSPDVRIEVMDVYAYLGPSYFSKGPISVKNFMKEMPASPSQKRVRFSDVKGEKQPHSLSMKGILKNGHFSKSELSSSNHSVKNTSSKRLKGSRFAGPKSAKIRSALHLSSGKINSTDNDEDSEDSTEESLASFARRGSPQSVELEQVIEETPSPIRKKSKLRKQDILSPESDLNCSSPRNSKKSWDKSDFVKQVSKNYQKTSPKKTLRESPSTPSMEENDDGEDPPTGRAKRHRTLHESPSTPSIEENDDGEDPPTGRGKRRGRKPVKYVDDIDIDDPVPEKSESDSGLEEDEAPRKKRKIVHDRSTPQKGRGYDPPEYQKALDKLLVDTPKSLFKPYICPKCHEGYVSTVKGKLHQLMVHDTRANFIVKLIRAEECEELAEILAKQPQVSYDSNLSISSDVDNSGGEESHEKLDSSVHKKDIKSPDLSLSTDIKENDMDSDTSNTPLKDEKEDIKVKRETKIKVACKDNGRVSPFSSYSKAESDDCLDNEDEKSSTKEQIKSKDEASGQTEVNDAESTSKEKSNSSSEISNQETLKSDEPSLSIDSMHEDKTSSSHLKATDEDVDKQNKAEGPKEDTDKDESIEENEDVGKQNKAEGPKEDTDKDESIEETEVSEAETDAKEVLLVDKNALEKTASDTEADEKNATPGDAASDSEVSFEKTETSMSQDDQGDTASADTENPEQNESTSQSDSSQDDSSVETHLLPSDETPKDCAVQNEEVTSEEEKGTSDVSDEKKQTNGDGLQKESADSEEISRKSDPCSGEADEQFLEK